MRRKAGTRRPSACSSFRSHSTGAERRAGAVRRRPQSHLIGDAIASARVGLRDQSFDLCPGLWTVALQALFLAIRTELRLTSSINIPIGCSLDGRIPNGAL